MSIQDYQLAVGHDNEAGLTNVESTLPTFRSRPFYVRGRGSFSEGVVRVKGDKGLYVTGYNTFAWQVSFLSYEQYAYLQTTYTTGGNSLSGPVTVRTRRFGGTYSNYNATIRLPKIADSDSGYLGIRNAVIVFCVDEAL